MIIFIGNDDELIRAKKDVQLFLNDIISTVRDFELYFPNIDEDNFYVLKKEKERWSLLKRLDAYDVNSTIEELEGDIYDLLYSIRKSVNDAFYRKENWDAYEM